MKKTCFVISPIGAKDSDTRKLADDLFDLIIEPSLEKFNFEIIRADKISTASSITADIIHHVQNSDLCIVDLTGRNPNVMYECGRRHETGKPFIMVAKEGEELPFDINTIRTFFYNVDNSRMVREVIKTIQEVVKNLLKEGFAPKSSGESLSTISDSLRRIERKLDDSIVNNSIGTESAIKVNDSLDILEKLKPIEAYAYALKNGDFKLAKSVFPYVIEGINDIGTAIYLSIPMADKLDLAAKIVEDNIMKIDPNNTDLNLILAHRNLMVFWVERDLAKDKMKFAEEITTYILNLAKDNEEKASILNQLQRIYYSSGEYDKALSGAQQVVELFREASYFYNLALILHRKNNLEESKYAIEEMLKFDTDDSDHLELAITVYKKLGNLEKAKELHGKLFRINEYKAAMIDLG